MWVVSITRRQRELNADLGSYLNARKSGPRESFFKKVESIIPKFSNDERVPEVSDVDATVVDEPRERRSFFSWLFNTAKNREDYDEEELEEIEHVEEELEDIEHHEEELMEEVEELEEKRESLLQRLFSFLSPRSRDEEDYEYEDEYEEEPDASSIRDQETRATLKIVHKWISRLPPEQIDAFKRSPDFQKYKELLELYNLIK